MVVYSAVFDETHNPLAKIGQNYQALAQDLRKSQFDIAPLTTAPITKEILQPHDILVIPCPTATRFSGEEIVAIDRWVREDGGGLLLLSHGEGDKEPETNLNELAQKFGISFEAGKVTDPKSNFGLGTSVKITNFIWHPVTEKVKDFCYHLGCTVSAAPPAIAVASSSTDSKPANVPVITAVQCEEGRVVAAGSYEILQDQVAPNLNYTHNAVLAVNIFQWLISDKRLQLHPPPPAKTPTPNGGAMEGVTTTKSNAAIISDRPEEDTNESHKVHDILNELVQMRTKVKPPGQFNTKLILVGDGNVGKTSLALKVTEQRFIKDYIPTLGLNIFRKTQVFGKDTALNWMIWDLGGQDIMRSLRKGFFAGAEAIFLVFDVTNPDSLQSIENQWLREFKDAELDIHEIPTLLLANKIDLVRNVKCSRHDIESFCQRHRLAYINVSALTGEHVPEALEILAYKFFENKEKQVPK